MNVVWSDIGDGSANGHPIPPAAASARGAPETTRAGADDDSVTRLLASTDEERALLEYVTRSARDFSLNHRPWSAEGSSRPQSSSRPSSSHSSLSSAAAVERLGPKINAFDVDAVAGRLKELVSLEKEALLEDIEALRRCLEDEAECMADAVGRAVDDADRISAEPPPDVAELRRYGARLRGVYAEEKERVEHEARVERLISGACGKKKSRRRFCRRRGGSSRLRRRRGGGSRMTQSRMRRSRRRLHRRRRGRRRGQGRRVQEESRIIA